MIIKDLMKLFEFLPEEALTAKVPVGFTDIDWETCCYIHRPNGINYISSGYNYYQIGKIYYSYIDSISAWKSVIVVEKSENGREIWTEYFEEKK